MALNRLLIAGQTDDQLFSIKFTNTDSSTLLELRSLLSIPSASFFEMGPAESLQFVQNHQIRGTQASFFDEIVCRVPPNIPIESVHAWGVFFDMVGAPELRLTLLIDQTAMLDAEIDEGLSRAGFEYSGEMPEMTSASTPTGRQPRRYLRCASRLGAGRMLVSVMENDKKTAVYKLTLLKSIAVASIRHPASVRFLSFEEAASHVRNLSKRWNYTTEAQLAAIHEPLAAVPFIHVVEAALEDFWRIWAPDLKTYADLSPEEVLLRSPRQIQGGRVPEFYPSLTALMRRYEYSWEMFRSALLGGKASNLDIELYRTAVRDLSTTFKKGPVYYSGSSLADCAGFNRIFSVKHFAAGQKRCNSEYAAQMRSLGELIMPASLWAEVRSHAPWLLDSLVLRWGELSAQLSRAAGMPGLASIVISRLLAETAERDVGTAAKIIAGMRAAGQPVRCIWTDEPLKPGNTEIDHMLPFAKLRSNDLWNLAPSLASVNNRKRDGIPSARFLRSRRRALTEWWSACCSATPELFRVQAVQALPGANRAVDSQSMPDVVFDGMLRLADILARQFQCNRWEL